METPRCVICLEALINRQCSVCSWCFAAAGPGFDGFVHTACWVAWRPGTCPLCRRPQQTVANVSAFFGAVGLCLVCLAVSEVVLTTPNQIVNAYVVFAIGFMVYTAVTRPYGTGRLRQRAACFMAAVVVFTDSLMRPGLFYGMHDLMHNLHQAIRMEELIWSLFVVMGELGMLQMCTYFYQK